MELTQVLAAIESIVGDDACEVWDMENAHRRFRGRSRLMHEKLSAVYRIAHSAQESHSCHHVHEDWRRETAAYVDALPAGLRAEVTHIKREGWRIAAARVTR